MKDTGEVTVSKLDVRMHAYAQLRTTRWKSSQRPWYIHVRAQNLVSVYTTNRIVVPLGNRSGAHRGARQKLL